MRFGTHFVPGSHVQGACVNPPQGPPGLETHAPASGVGAHVQLASPVSSGQLQMVMA